MEIESIIKRLIEEHLAEINIKIDTITYQKEENTNVLRIIIDKDPYINVDDCVAATNIISPIIDKEDIINDTYVLDVCSKTKGGDK
ncbi:MAG: hypothetical protein PHI22_01555 [Bacilli bacterium]|nr:hypothetical protein [Bacilli bacterium]MDD4298172.1 hypothetical protein [Bacilli bacterium]MDD4643418.1 hypothetical protein [Bacilli bacterium]